MPETIAAKEAYSLAKRVSKHVVWSANSEAEKEAFAHISPYGNEIFHIAKQMDKTNQDVVGEKCMKNDAGELSLSDDRKMKSWVEYYIRLLNVEFQWPSDTDNVAPTSYPPPPVATPLINEAIKKMKFRKAAGPSGIVVEMLAASGEKGVDLLTRLTECVYSNGVIPTDWQESFILNLYKRKGDAWERGNYRGLKLTDQVMKLVEHVLEIQIRQMININEMQFGFVPGRGTTDAIFIICQLQEKYLAVNKPLYLAFVDLYKAFDRVPRKVIWWAMRKVGVEEWTIWVVQGMYKDAKSRVRINGKYSEDFNVNVGVHQGLVLSPLLFIIILEALSREFHTGVPWELLYADDLALIAESLEECIEKFEAWKSGMESKGLRVNSKKMKFMVSCIGLGQLRDSGAFPCGVCRTGVGANSILCSQCSFWIHKKCSGIIGRLSDNPEYICSRCQGTACPIEIRPINEVFVDEIKMDVVLSFFYLGDMLSAGDGCDLAVTTRCLVAWGKFRKLLPILTLKHVSLKTRGKLLHGSETWAPTVSVLQKL